MTVEVPVVIVSTLVVLALIRVGVWVYEKRTGHPVGISNRKRDKDGWYRN